MLGDCRWVLQVLRATLSAMHSESPTTSASPSTSREEHGDSCCWICLDDAPDELIQPCDCPRSVHRKCMARWQLQKTGSTCELASQCLWVTCKPRTLGPLHSRAAHLRIPEMGQLRNSAGRCSARRSAARQVYTLYLMFISGRDVRGLAPDCGKGRLLFLLRSPGS